MKYSSDPQAYHREKSKAFYWANREVMLERARKWRKDNRERHNAHRHLRRLRAMKDPLPRHIRKMAELAAKYPKRRIVYRD